jgi:hypothetical protein
MKKLFVKTAQFVCVPLALFCNIYFMVSVKAQPKINFNPILRNLNTPVKITNAGDGSGRLFIVEQGGLIKDL